MSLREYWHDEARDFTPWLAEEENLALLSETIGLNLELVAVEQYVGPFRADVIARDEDIQVIVENQLDTTDHKHLRHRSATIPTARTTARASCAAGLSRPPPQTCRPNDRGLGAGPGGFEVGRPVL